VICEISNYDVTESSMA